MVFQQKFLLRTVYTDITLHEHFLSVTKEKGVS